ncbi:MAG: His/Gly/Thr/Pro-type tRNA ligase C-terminal domain-containing protein, partial [candidate division WWE3 bacterium]|nr:His/Gly/Thr/Pro-type tRNA ligase C-terminal domain-containing protein [candidate division WWE3 bacterium]
GEDYRYRLSLGDRSDSKKYYKDDKAWDYAEGVLRKVLKETNAPFYEVEGEAAFYGPKIDVQIKRLSGKEETAFTVQYDFVMPKRFDLTYIDAMGKEKELVVIHRASIGCLERTMAFLIEKYHGNFPVWLAPIQAAVIPISVKLNRYGQEVRNALKDRGIRVWLDERGEKMQAKIRDAQLQKIPYMLVVGEKEEKGKAVAVRLRTGRDLGLTKLTDFTNKIAEISSSYSLNLWDGPATPNLAISKKWDGPATPNLAISKKW